MGLGTALRILYDPEQAKHLHRNHIVALFNVLGRFSHSVEVARIVLPLLGHISGSGIGTATEFGQSEDMESGHAGHTDAFGRSHAKFNPFQGGSVGI